LTDLQDERYSSFEMTDFSRRGTVSRLFAALALSVSAAFANTQADPAQEIRRNETLAPGIEHLEVRRGDRRGLIRILFLCLSLTKCGCHDIFLSAKEKWISTTLGAIPKTLMPPDSAAPAR